jgi:hypothetical protein
MKLSFLLVLVCGCGVLAAHRQGAHKPASAFEWKIAQRLDSGRVVIMLTDEDAAITNVEHDALDPMIPKPAGEFLASFLDGLRPLPADMGRRLTKSAVAVGDRWAIDAGRGGWFDTSIDGFVLNGGCSETAAVMASISPDKLAEFSSVKDKYFPAHTTSGWAPPARATAVGPMAYVVTPDQRAKIESVLRQAFERDSPTLLQQMSQDSHAEGVDAWRDKYRRIAAGGGQINFDTQAFQVTPDGLPRLFVRAVWTLDGKPAYAMSAWLRTAPALGIEQSDTHTAKFAWFSEFQHYPMEPKENGEVLGVTDIDRDGFGEIVMVYYYYESISIEVSKYPPAGPGSPRVVAKFSSGC